MKGEKETRKIKNILAKSLKLGINCQFVGCLQKIELEWLIKSDGFVLSTFYKDINI